jgi:hypothetical protein
VRKELLNKLHQDQEKKNEDDTTKCEQVSNQDTRKFIVEPQLHFMQEGNEGSPKSALKTLFCSTAVNQANTRSIPLNLRSARVFICKQNKFVLRANIFL